MKKTDIILLIAVAVIFLLSAFVIKVDNKADKMSSKTMLSLLSYSEYTKKIESGEKFVVIIERTGCSYCEKYMPIVKKVSKEYNTEIYYIDTSKLSEEEMNSLMTSNDYFNNNDDWGTPTTLLLEGSSAVDVISGYVEKKELVNFLKDNGIVK